MSYNLFSQTSRLEDDKSVSLEKIPLAPSDAEKNGAMTTEESKNIYERRILDKTLEKVENDLLSKYGWIAIVFIVLGGMLVVLIPFFVKRLVRSKLKDSEFTVTDAVELLKQEQNPLDEIEKYREAMI